jgi:hypothetical protein
MDEIAEATDIIDAEVIPETALMRTSQPVEPLTPVMDLQLAKARLKEFQAFVAGYLKEGEDYGTIPGTPKPTLYKSGADKLCELYGLADIYDIKGTIDWDKGLFDYEVCCKLHRGERLIATGWGSCSSWESRYRWREEPLKCPNCHKPNIIKGRAEYGGGWICWAKKGGCGAKFPEQEVRITSQPQGKIPNPDIVDLKNTILKMAKKRAKIDATLAATRSSGLFTQDMEDAPAVPTPQGKENYQTFKGVIDEVKTFKEAGCTVLKIGDDKLTIKDLGIDAQIAHCKKGDYLELRCLQQQGTRKMYWEVIQVLRIGDYNATDPEDDKPPDDAAEGAGEEAPF